MAPITAMFDGMAKRDAAAIKKPLLPGGGMVLMRDGKPTQMTFDAFAEAWANPANRLRSAFTIRWCASITIWPWCGRRLTFWWTAKWTTAERICSILFAPMESGSSRAWQTPGGRIVRRNRKTLPLINTDDTDQEKPKPLKRGGTEAAEMRRNAKTLYRDLRG